MQSKTRPRALEIDAQQQTLFNFLESLHELAWQRDLETDEFRLSAPFWKALGYTPDTQPAPTRKAARKLVHPVDADLAEEELELHLRSEKPFELEFRIKAADGQWHYLRMRGCITEWSATGAPSVVTGIMTDITDKVARARAKREAEEMLGALSTRERQVVRGLLAGAANKNIAYELGISQRTVEGYRARLMEKLGVRSVSELIQIALVGGVVCREARDCGSAHKVSDRP